jgi:DNA-binding NtrC family response regulator
MANNGHARRPTVLFVDDCPSVREIAGRALQANGCFELLMARDGLAALGALSSNGGRLSLLITDTEMPGLDGWDVVRYARLRCPDLPILRLGRRGDLIPSAELEVFRTVPVLEKPLRAESLVASVHACLADQTLRRAANGDHVRPSRNGPWRSGS